METAVPRAVNNAIYEELGERWYKADDDPVALLRAESRLRNPWLASQLRQRCGDGARVLDVGCGAGFLANHLAREGFDVSGVDASPDSLAVAARYDETGKVRYAQGDALALPYADASFDAVCAMDFLEHVEEPEAVVRECSRVLRPGGLFFFHTFNRNRLAWLIVIKGVEWFVKNTPPDLHILRLFIRPDELRTFCRRHNLDVAEIRGVQPVIGSLSFWRMLATGIVPAGFRFEFVRSTLIGYSGFAERRA
jgi:2-polyprenyl-6-hydroxyphenyl methylase/3-demethylubiquinone-9 3-methyltransferase